MAILPARLGSTRLPRKMLLRETGAYLFEHSARNVLTGGAVERVVVATDSEEILDAARAVGLEALMTDAAHQSGTDRVHEAWRALAAAGEGPFDVVLNVQADEPDVAAADLARLVDAFHEDAVELATLCTPLAPAEAARPSAVKVVRAANGDALYFSRAAIPDASHARAGAAPTWLRHVGVYAFRPDALARFVALPPSPLERAENLEQLRWLEAGGRLRVLDAAHAPTGIDTAADYEAFVTRTAHRSPHPSANP
ncbi:MAG: 3-deoxy-manno-octulosonate cytidylyltransferase [Planctomycetes bacterium]|nr:3-deoxy-manno-octulosonate cytidylyltransferase [Planctomycetota bacterium]